jgi:transcription-repair coupling factor (superfamily II helicase)
VAQELAPDMPRVAAAARHVFEERPSVEVLICPTESLLARTHEELVRLLGPERFRRRVVTVPGFVQAGVFRFESARPTLAMRLSGLFRLLQGESSLVLTSVRGIARFVPSPLWVSSHGMRLACGQTLELEDFVSRLQTLGYLEVPSVDEVGDYAVRGGIVDLWIPGHVTPHRLEIFGDEIDEIRSFRPSDGRSYRGESEIIVLPCREFVWPPESERDPVIERLNAMTLAQRIPGQTRADLFDHVRQGVPFVGIDDAAASLFSDGVVSQGHRVDVFGDDGRYTTLVRYIEQVARDHGQSMRLRCAGDAASFDRQLVEDVQLYERTAVTARHKGFLQTPFASVFRGLRFEARELVAKTFLEALAAEVDSKPAPPHLPESLAQLFSSEDCRKSKGRLQALSDVLRGNPSHLGSWPKVRRLHVGVRSEATLPEVRGLLQIPFPEIDTQASTNALEFGLSFQGNEEGQGPMPWSVDFFVGDIQSPLFLDDSQTLVVSESWLRGSQHGLSAAELPQAADAEGGGAAASRANAQILMQAQFSEFSEGDLVVHVQHGVGRFQGLATVKIGEASGDFLVIEYAGRDKIYVPVDKLNLVQRYIVSDAANVTLDALATQSWEKKREKARKDAERVAKQMLEHQARRQTAGAHVFGRHDEDMLGFESAFPYDETPDQLKSAREIFGDMCSDKAMDRLLCGDVGFGKTEVAMRAAYLAVLDGRQVAWLVPTTVLAHQHFRSAQERFSAFGVRVALLDRGQGTRALRLTLEAIAAGQVDVLIGTHRILSPDVVFSRLGLLVVDEEQRFGVVQKERIKNMAYGVDVLTMTATPIPRTLQMAMLGMRDLSLLTTPPKSRLSVKTLVSPFDDETIKFAIETELARAGQVFYVHNRVHDLEAMKGFLEKLVPGLRVAVGHGQMVQKQLDDRVIEFLDGKYDVLLCTTIIESGIDMPNVNTIIIQDADCFGLAQLYQLRGRVGRRSARGYAYFLLSPGLTEKDEGYKRIEILREHQALGSGFVIASHDLEMRGGGHILGDDQSGHMSEVGLETYNQMLDEAIQTLGGVRPSRLGDVDVKLPIDVKIPESYIHSSQERLRYYRRFFAAGSEEALKNLVDECADRFGPLPSEVERLAMLARVKRLAAQVHALSVTVSAAGTEIKLEPALLQGGTEHEDLVRRILDVCNRRERDVRLTPDGRILYLGVRAKDFTGDSLGPSLIKLQMFLGLVAGASQSA